MMAKMRSSSRVSPSSGTFSNNRSFSRFFFSQPGNTVPEEEKTVKFIKSFIKMPSYQVEKDKPEVFEPTNAFGEIEFVGSSTRTAKYVRVANNTSGEILQQLLYKHWKISPPNLIISVTGGAKNFSMRSRLKEVFHRSLIKASENTGAWITTGGTHNGVMKHVGKAVKNYAAIRDDSNRVVTIGIATWGVIYEREKLINKQYTDPLQPKLYDPDESLKGGNAILDYNHSHFILVDNSTTGEYGGEIPFRASLESDIAKTKNPKGVDVLIVCVIVQGGPGSLKAVSESITNDTPVVIVQGSGGWADVLAAAYSMGIQTINEKEIERLCTDYNLDINPDKIGEWTQNVKKCLSKKNLLTVFDFDPNDATRDLDIAILEALFKAKSGEEGQAHQQLKLAMDWNRSDIAKSHILNDDASSVIGKKQIADMFFLALKSNKFEFCKVFLDHGVDLKEYCTVGELEKLYESMPRKYFLFKKLQMHKEHSRFTLQQLEKVMLEYLGQSYVSVYKRRKKDSKKYSAVDIKEDASDQEMLERNWPAQAKMDDPYREIFQWALLMNYREIARHVWEYVFGSMSAAIVATKILKGFASRETDFEKKTQFNTDADEYEQLAVGVLGNCFDDNVDKTMPLLIDRLPKWGGYTCLHVAIKADDKLFVSRPGVQYFFDIVWMSNLSEKTSSLHIVLAGICPLLILTTIRFKEKEEERDEPKTRSEDEDIEMQELSNNGSSQALSGPIFNNPEPPIKTPTKPLSTVNKLKTFYDAPVVTFWLNVVAFLIYLILFAFVILSDFNPTTVTVSAWEYVLIGWTGTFVLEEIREFADEEARYLSEKFLLHIFDPWNIMDFISLTLFYVAFGIRWVSFLLDEALILYSVSFLVQCVRIVHIFAVHRILGPKIIMVGKMLKDLLFFLFILVVFLIAYGVASQALLYPGEKNFGDIIVGIVYKPYWQIYGELFLEEINYDPNVDEFTCSNTDVNLPRCPRQSTIVPIISAVYLLFANVLLLNLLIAMFSYTFEKIQQKGFEIWMFQRYKLITDYYFRPPLVPPLIILSHIYIFFRFISRHFTRGQRDEPFFHAMKCDLSVDERKMLRKWEHWHTEAFLQQKRIGDNTKVENQVSKLNDRINIMMSSLEDMQERLTQKRGEGRRIDRLNNTMLSNFRHIEKMIESVKSGGSGKTPFLNEKSMSSPVSSSTSLLQSSPQSLPPVEEVPPSKSKPPPTPKKDTPPVDLHVKARTKTYPESNVQRTPIPDDKVMWTVEWPEYSPKEYTAQVVLNCPIWADDYLEGSDPESRRSLPYNKYDQNDKVNRASHMGAYMVIDGIPRNPRGRTGLVGRGLLGRYGPNHAADPVITRWRRDKNRQIVKIDDKPVLEFVAIKRADTGDWAIPGGMVDPGEKVSSTLRREFSEEALNIDGITDLSEVEKIKQNIQALFNSGGLEMPRRSELQFTNEKQCRYNQLGKPLKLQTRKENSDELKLFKGYCDDHRNTDNAWIETVACNFHDEEGTAFNDINLNPGDEANKVNWRKVDRNLKLFASHSAIIKKAADMHNAYF